jgi:metal-dependent amidase/aminoacylase/carboxypeptidase family protein
MDAEAILQYDTMNLSNEQCATLRGDLARTLGEAAHAYGVEVELGFHAVPMGGVYAREAVIKGSEKDVLEAMFKKTVSTPDPT